MNSLRDNMTKASWRRLLGMTLRGYMLLMLLIGGVLGYIIHVAKVQREVVTQLRRAQWSIDYSWDWNGDLPIQNGKPWAPSWLVSQVGVDFFGHVHSLGHTQATDVMLEWVGRLDQLEDLNLFGNEVTDVGVEKLQRMNSLRALYLNGTSMTDAGTAHLKGLTQLRFFGFQNSAFSDAGLMNLAGMKRLEFLSLNTTTIGDAGLAHLTGLTSLTELALDNAPVTDAGLVHLRGLKKLKTLWLGGTKVTPEGVNMIKKALPNLEIKGVD